MLPLPWMVPAPTTFALDADGVPITPYSIEFRVTTTNGTQVSGGSDPTWNAAVAIGTGYYKAPYSDAGSAGRRIVEWRMMLTNGGPYTTWSTEWEKGRMPSPSPVYAFVSDVRDEGVTTADASDARVTMALQTASAMVNEITGRIFAAFYSRHLVNGRGRGAVLLTQPVIGVSELVIGAASLASAEAAIDATSYRVYNRHITQMLLVPDDRENPKIELVPGTSVSERLMGERRHVPRGVQNVRVSGVFGYTDPDGSPSGYTPALIKRATVLLALRYIGGAADGDANVANVMWRVTQERTREQVVQYADPMSGRSGGRGGNALLGAFTGDPEIDQILARYVRPPMIAAV